MKLSNARGRPSPFRKSEEDSGERSKSAMSPRLENGSPPRRDSVGGNGKVRKPEESRVTLL